MCKRVMAFALTSVLGLLLWLPAAHADIELSVAGDTGPITIEPGDSLIFRIVASGCPSSNRWRDTWLRDGVQLNQEEYTTSPCDDSPFNFGPLSFSDPGVYEITYQSEYRVTQWWGFQWRDFDQATIEVRVREPLQCVNDDFQRSALGADWSTSSRSGSFGNPRIVEPGRLRLTDATGNVSTAATLQRRFPFAENRVIVEFDHYAYAGGGGTGADGITLSFSDISITPEPGGFGGSLGYAQRSGGISGFAGGWVGVGLDEFGNFSNPSEGRQGGPGRRTQSLAIRGSGSGTSGYRYLRGTNSLTPGVAQASSSSPAPGHRYRITLDAETPGQAMVSVERDTGSGFQSLVAPFNALAETGQAAPPEALLLTLTGSTGGSTNIHEVGDFEVCALQIDPLDNPIDHFRIEHSGQALTCAPEPVTITACANPDCTEQYTEPVDLTLGPSGWVGGDNQTLAGGSDVFDLRRTQVGTVNVQVLGSEPSASNITRCFRNSVEGDCSLQFRDSGFLFGDEVSGFGIPNQLAARPSEPVVIQAVRADPDNPESCGPAFQGSRDVGFWFDYANPSGGTESLTVNGQPLSTTSPGTPVTLNFDANARASIELNYPDAGRLALNARFQGTGDEAGLVMTGSSSFVVRPDTFCIDSTNADWPCDSQSHTCTVLAAAGAAFPLRVRAVQWDETLPACDRATTPNYEGSINLTSQLLAPADPGVEGVLSVAAATIPIGGEIEINNQSYSEVGAIRVQVNSDGNYLGAPGINGSSAPMGRFTPDRFVFSNPADGILASACGVFSYMQQTIAHTSPATVDIEAVNADGQRTRNYQGDWASLNPVAPITAHDGALPAGIELVEFQDTSFTLVVAGIGTLTIDGQVVYDRQDSLPVAPFDGGIRHTLSVEDDDGVSSGSDPFTIDARFPTGNEQLRWGRMEITNVHGPEIQPLIMPLFVSFFDGNGFVVNSADNCTSLVISNLQLTDDAGIVTTDGTASVGGDPTTVTFQDGGVAVNGRLDLNLSAPGATNTGSVFIQPLLGTDDADLPHLQFDWNGDGTFENPVGRATFGVYQGRQGIIDRRER